MSWNYCNAHLVVLICSIVIGMVNQNDALGEDSSISPNLVTHREAERTGFQEAGPYAARSDLRTDFVMAYGLNDTLAERLQQWRKAGYQLHVMSGVSWGEYQDFLQGKFDGREHWDEMQVAADGSSIMHGPTVPYMVPSVAFADYLEAGIRRAIDAGAIAIHLEEPEFWARAGFSEAFKREWKTFYREDWIRPDSSPDAQYRASKLKYYLYRRTLDRLCSSMKEYALVRHQRSVRFYVPTHSLLNYAQWKIVSPESALLDLPGIDGYIAQIWTGTARTPNVYCGKSKERTFETAYLEYGVMQELVRGTDRRMWFLHDPIEDNPRHDWTDYRENYIRTLVASLLHPYVSHYEVCPWPARVYHERYPSGENGQMIPADYATTLSVVFNQLRDLDQQDVAFDESTTGVGVFLSDSAMFQRAAPAFSDGAALDSNDRTRATRRELQMLSGFYGLALPLLKHGVPIRPVQLDNLVRAPGYLDDMQVLVLSYEFMKPLTQGLHLVLAQWVIRGGRLIYVGAETDPFHGARDWWNEGKAKYDAPTQHLFESLGLPRQPEQGVYEVGRGKVYVERCHPAWLTRSAENAQRLRDLVAMAVADGGQKLIERNVVQLRRGPYLIAAAMDESLTDTPLRLTGNFVDVLDPQLALRSDPELAPGRQTWLIDLARVQGASPLLLAAAGRVEQWKVTENTLDYTIATPVGTPVVTRILLPAVPKQVLIDDQAPDGVQWDDLSKTVLLRHAAKPDGVVVTIRW